MTSLKYVIATVIAILIVAGVAVNWQSADAKVQLLWQEAVAPGALSQSHAFLAKNCAACHVPLKGIEPSLCISCHADNKALLQRQPTAFHANIQQCIGCHTEHKGTMRMPTTMDHAMLVKSVEWEMKVQEMGAINSSNGLNAKDIEEVNKLMASMPAASTKKLAPTVVGKNGAEQNCDIPGGCKWSQGTSKAVMPMKHRLLTASESNLSCVSCHATKDRHQGMLGTTCVQCHATKNWTVEEFRHPSVNSTMCAQCHKPPPSHNMMHFSMMSAPIAGQPNAKVNQCYLCHQSTSWNDIKGVGWKKLH